MTTLEDARARFEQALERVEAALKHDEGHSAKNATLRAERDRLADALAKLQAEHDALKAAAGSVSQRLDRTIAQVRTMVDE